MEVHTNKAVADRGSHPTMSGSFHSQRFTCAMESFSRASDRGIPLRLSLDDALPRLVASSV